MCGIVAIFSYLQSGQYVNKDELITIRDSMEKRGPDGFGCWVSKDNKIGLAHRRLAILDLTDAAKQPLFSHDGKLGVVFNGEIYNYRELREQLRAKGYQFRSDSDTEVLLYAYHAYGQEMVEHLRGMFAFAIWDEDRQGLFLARDHFGIKPLYYHDDGKVFRIASQVKALISGKGIYTQEEPAGHVGFYLWGCVPDPFTLYRNIFSLPAGHSLWVDNCGPRAPHKYFDIANELIVSAEKNIDYAVANPLQNAVRDSVKHHLISDVPVGVFLSSGLDSATLTALATESIKSYSDGGLQAITLGFSEYENTPADEVPLARVIARHYGCLHHVGRITHQDFQEGMSSILDDMDQPSIDGVNTWFVAREAKRAGLKVAISGLGGDELLGGYPSFRHLPRLVSRSKPFTSVPGLGKSLRIISAAFLKHSTSPKYASLFEYGGTYGGAYLLRRGLYMPWELSDFLDKDFIREGWASLQPVIRLSEWVSKVKTPHAKVVGLEMGCYMRNMLLRDSDWAGMAHSLEIRTPLVDVTLFRSLAPHITSNTPPLKRDLANIPRLSLPDKVINRPKTGFSVPVNEWIKTYSDPLHQRGLRGWSQIVNKTAAFHYETPKKEILALVSDAFGGRGGIAKFNRDLLWALCSAEQIGRVVALPRQMPDEPENIPVKLYWDISGVGGKLKYLGAVWAAICGNKKLDMVLCGHLNLLPLAMIAAYIRRAPLLCFIHGIDAWQPSKSLLVNHLLSKVDRFVAVSNLTRQRFSNWTGIQEQQITLLPNCYDPMLFFPASKKKHLLDHYGLHGKFVLLTVGRLVSSEGYKGFDEVIDILPELSREVPDIVYMIIGDGDDRIRLENKARTLGVANMVIFTGYIKESEKTDHYRLADVYVMPSRGEGFGIVFLEAMACGVSAIGSKLDGSREALADGKLGLLVDPDNPEEIKSKILEALTKNKLQPPAGLDFFSLGSFRRNVQTIIDSLGNDNGNA